MISPQLSKEEGKKDFIEIVVRFTYTMRSQTSDQK